MSGTGSRDAAITFLQKHGTATTPHIFADLFSHLLGTEALVREWGGDEMLALTALGHATYGTDGFAPNILELGERDVLADAIGAEAEALVYFYASCDRRHFYPQLTDQQTTLTTLVFRDRFTGTECTPTDEYVQRFVDLTFANESELAAAAPGGPSEWAWLGGFCQQSRRWASPSFYAGAAALLQLEP
jgi:hypothetical protein